MKSAIRHVLVTLCFLCLTAEVTRAADERDVILERAIIQELSRDRRIPLDKIAVTVNNGKVSVVGRVSTPAEKELVAEAVSRVAGESVSLKRLRVTPPHVPDEEIRANVYRALPQLALANIPNLTVTVNRGRVALFGTASTPEYAVLAENAAKRVPGAVSVENRITATLERPPSDDMIQSSIRAQLDPYLNSPEDIHTMRNITVGVDRGHVTLTGEVRDADQRRYIEDVARTTPGVVGVTNEIVFRPRAAFH